MPGFSEDKTFNRGPSPTRRPWGTQSPVASSLPFRPFATAPRSAHRTVRSPLLSIRNLRSREAVERGEKIYHIPNGGLFRWVSSPNYLCELVGWAGFALCTWSLAGVFVFVISAANLIPRAAATHRRYRDRFEDDPKERKALLPLLW